MSNRLKMAIAHAIYQLHSLHWSQRRIARELGINRETVRRHLSCRLSSSWCGDVLLGACGRYRWRLDAGWNGSILPMQRIGKMPAP
jgi:hypothetical protein